MPEWAKKLLGELGDHQDRADEAEAELESASHELTQLRAQVERFVERVDVLDREDEDYETFSDHLLDELDVLRRSLAHPEIDGKGRE